jgi:metal-responsive CopG/Arc/MetJ family transcriptional regulator
VPNVRAKGQTLISFPIDEEFLAKLDAARGHKTRSQFIREAIYKECHRLGDYG